MNKILWFRFDLRLHDNEAVKNAIIDGNTLPIFIFDEEYYYMSNNNVIATDSTPTYKGIPLNAKVFPGWGRTWNLGLTYRF